MESRSRLGLPYVLEKSDLTNSQIFVVSQVIEIIQIQ